MKRIISVMVAALIAAATMYAQQIAVVNGSGSTTIFESLDEAITGAETGSTVYIPGGGFQLKEETKITKKLTIMGIGHKADSENADGNTTISGNIQFAPGSDGSAIMGVYLSNNIKIGVGGRVKNILVRYCNMQEIEVKTDTCPGIIINQNYIRGNVHFAHSPIVFTNNIANGIEYVNGGTICNNLFFGDIYTNSYYGNYSFQYINNSTLKNNLSLHGDRSSSNNLWQDNLITAQWSSYIVRWDGAKTTSDVHFNDTYEGSKEIGIYGGTGFSDDCLPPMPYIVSKSIAEQTDSQGKLKIQVTVKTK